METEIFTLTLLKSSGAWVIVYHSTEKNVCLVVNYSHEVIQDACKSEMKYITERVTVNFYLFFTSA